MGQIKMNTAYCILKINVSVIHPYTWQLAQIRTATQKYL